MPDYESVLYRSLQDRSVVITGGASGIGEEMVKAFVSQGARVAFLDIDNERGEAVASETGASFHACDLTDIASLRAVLARIEDEQDGIDALVNNAGKDDRHALADVEPDGWRQALSINLDHQFFATQAEAVARLQEVMERAADKTVYLKGDKNAPYGAIMNMMAALRKAGIETVGLITEKRQEKAEGGQ